MKKEIIEKEIYDLISKKETISLEFIQSLYYKLFNSFPDMYDIIWELDGTMTSYNLEYIDCRKKFHSGINPSTLNDHFHKLSPIYSNVFYSRLYDIKIIIGNNFILSYSVTTNNLVSHITVACKEEDHDEIFNKIKINLDPDNLKRNPRYYYVVYGPEGINTLAFKLKNNLDVCINENYNDDIPYKQLLSFCNSEKCGLTLLYGVPGCGKTTIIKNLIKDSDNDFYLMDSSMLDAINDNSFMRFMSNTGRDSVIILEDCEKLLQNRQTSVNPWIGTLLNLTDGMLGEALNIKFICTFNADLKSIDPALLRPGRLDICYELTPLSKEKSENLCNKMNIPCKGRMTLAEIYKTKIDNSKLNNTNKIGFN